MRDFELEITHPPNPAECECALWTCAGQPASSYFLVASDGTVLTHHPACRHRAPESLSDEDLEVLIELSTDDESLNSPAMSAELERARAWASRWKALAKALYAELAVSTRIETDGEILDTPSSASGSSKPARTSGLRLRPMLAEDQQALYTAAASHRRR